MLSVAKAFLSFRAADFARRPVNDFFHCVNILSPGNTAIQQIFSAFNKGKTTFQTGLLTTAAKNITNADAFR